MPLNLDSCIEGIFTPGAIGASSGLPPVVPTVPSLVGAAPAVWELVTAIDTLDAFYGELLHEAASASDSYSSTGGAFDVLVAETAAAVDTAYLAEVFDVALADVLEATDDPSVYDPAIVDADVTEAATAADDVTADVDVDTGFSGVLGIAGPIPPASPAPTIIYIEV